MYFIDVISMFKYFHRLKTIDEELLYDAYIYNKVILRGVVVSTIVVVSVVVIGRDVVEIPPAVVVPTNNN